MANSSSNNQTTYLIIGAACLAITGLALYLSLPNKSSGSGSGDGNDKSTGITPTKSNSSKRSTSTKSTAASTTTTSNINSSSVEDDKSLHRRIEEIDREGKALFKNKEYTAAAECFTKALELIDLSNSNTAATNNNIASSGGGGESNSESKNGLMRQVVTLMNNRSAMYEKASLPDLALSDCDAVLERDPSHVKARTRRLRILESLNRYSEAIVEVCALQLKYMHDNRDKIRLGLPPSGSPPVPQSKIEELVLHILPAEIETVQQRQQHQNVKDRVLPSTYTITQLLKSFSGYNAWMGEGAKFGGVEVFTSKLVNDLPSRDDVEDAAYVEKAAEQAKLLYGRGRRYAFEKQFEKAVKDFDASYDLTQDNVGGEQRNDHEEVKKAICDAVGKDIYARILEWQGMCRHLRYDLEGALKCYEECSELEPENTELIVKRAGVKMDGANHADAEKLFAQALKLNSTAPDALLHRANLRMLQQRAAEAESDLETCIRLYPNNLLARLRLATVFMAKEDISGANRMLDQAAEYDPDSSEVHCYRGELHFARGEFDEAKAEFEKAMKCDPSNPTPYVNSALAVINTPPSGGSMVPDFAEAITLLEKAISVDPMFHSAYVQLGQMKLSIATDLTKAREVVELYDKGLEYCRTPDEVKDICSMRILTMAQIDAAHALNMESLQMQ